MQLRIWKCGPVLLGSIALLVGTTSPARASDTSFFVEFVHDGGAGAIGAETSGGITWFNRSVSLTNVQLFVHAGECADIDARAYFRNNNSWVQVASQVVQACNSTSAGVTFSVQDLGFDCGAIVGGCGKVQVFVIDEVHGIAENDYFR